MGGAVRLGCVEHGEEFDALSGRHGPVNPSDIAYVIHVIVGAGLEVLGRGGEEPHDVGTRDEHALGAAGGAGGILPGLAFAGPPPVPT
ncbi:hypothetical protein ACLGIH_01430 [Streptomyces sp. HMX87]|uniref:hypothetical protein n=1 Tax=Streptomyces sp. HMX87 TaxID=3390849 RepID=UPI003A83A324